MARSAIALSGLHLDTPRESFCCKWSQGCLSGVIPGVSILVTLRLFFCLKFHHLCSAEVLNKRWMDGWMDGFHSFALRYYLQEVWLSSTVSTEFISLPR